MGIKKAFSVITIIAIMAVSLCSCSSGKKEQIPHRFATAEEGRELLLSNDEYFSQFTQNDIDFRMQKTGATMDEYLAASADQIGEFSAAEKSYLNRTISKMEKTLEKNGYTLPPIDEIVFIKTSMSLESGASGYTHGTQIYLSSDIVSIYTYLSIIEGNDYMEELLWHELFHCLTRCNPDFREEMYSLIDFTVTDSDFPLPPSVAEYHISNPDVEHHNSYATFIIDGQEIDCFTDMVTTAHFDEVQTTFFGCDTTALIPIDGTDIYYTPEQASNFDEVFGTNTGYVTDPEECLADNFAYAMLFGIEGRDGQGYPNPEIIQGVIDIVSR